MMYKNSAFTSRIISDMLQFLHILLVHNPIQMMYRIQREVECFDLSFQLYPGGRKQCYNLEDFVRIHQTL